MSASVPEIESEKMSEPGVKSAPGTPTWEIAHLFPQQGDWSEGEYLALETNRLIEFKDGCLEFLPMPSLWHQIILRSLFLQLHTWVTARNQGVVLFAPLRVRLRPNLIREPDIVYLKPHRIRDLKTPPTGADLMMEVISPGKESRERDEREKRDEYAAAGIPEYWIVDPELERITVLVLTDAEYRVHGEFDKGTFAQSATLEGFRVDVTVLFTPPPVEGN